MSFQWLSQYVIKLYDAEARRSQMGQAQEGQKGPGFLKLDSHCFDKLTVKYANQMATERNYELALALCLHV